MAETADYDPGPWSGHDFKSARGVYDAHAGRSYDDAKKSGKTVADLVVPNLTTNSPSPLVVISDVTGSMGEWPAVMFSKLPYLDKEGQEYLGPEMEICFGAVGDAHTDAYPLQVRPFAKGLDLESRLKELVIEGEGGGQIMETYELAALYFARKVSLPKAVNPILIMIGDEAPYDWVEASHAKKYAGVEMQQKIATAEVFEELKAKFVVYLIRKPYAGHDEHINRVWASLLGQDHIVDLPQADRVVDVIFGILAKETGKIPYFRAEIEGRQTAAQVKTVYKSLETVHANVTKGHSGKSVMLRASGGMKSKSVLDE